LWDKNDRRFVWRYLRTNLCGHNQQKLLPCLVAVVNSYSSFGRGFWEGTFHGSEDWIDDVCEWISVDANCNILVWMVRWNQFVFVGQLRLFGNRDFGVVR
jgi:hypothetical protein